MYFIDICVYYVSEVLWVCFPFYSMKQNIHFGLQISHMYVVVFCRTQVRPVSFLDSVLFTQSRK